MTFVIVIELLYQFYFNCTVFTVICIVTVELCVFFAVETVQADSTILLHKT